MFWLIIGIAIGIFIPAPYDLIARRFLGNVWNWIKSFGS